MKTKAVTMFNAITGIDERYLSEAEAHPAKPRNAWRRWAAIAASLVLAAGLGTILLLGRGPASSGNGTVPNDEYYSVYVGPVLPMTAQGDLDGLTLTREVDYDFSPYTADKDVPGSALVTDRYVLTNLTNEEKHLTLCYPVSGRLSDETLRSLAFTVDGAAVTPDFHLGHGIEQTKEYTLSWNEYRELLDQPDNLRSSLLPEATLDDLAIVYTLAKDGALEDAENHVRLQFRIDPEKTGVFVSGITSYSSDKNTGEVTLNFYVDRRATSSSEPCTLVLMGGDLDAYALEASDGNGSDGWRLDRQETSLKEAILAYYVWMTGEENASPDQTSFAAVARLLEDRGWPTLQNAAYEGLTSTGDLITAAWNMSRVMYETVNVVVPAGESMIFVASLEKEASYRTDSSAQQGGDGGYDLITQAGSALNFTEQSASVAGLDYVEIVDNNFGFDPEAGITAVTLDLDVPYYWMHLRRSGLRNSSGLPAAPVSTEAEGQFPSEMSMEELEEKLGFGYTLFNEDAYPGTIVSKYDDSLGETGGILLEYTFDGFFVYAMKYEESGIDAYDGWETEYAERGSEVINGVEVRFRGQPMVPDYRGVAFWKQNGYQFILNCETAPGSDIMSVLPLFMELPLHGDQS